MATFSRSQYLQSVLTSVTFGSLAQSVFAVGSFPVDVSGSTTAEFGQILFCDASAGDITITLPSAISNTSASLTVIKTDSTSNKVTLSPTLSQTISGNTSITTITQYTVIEITSDGSNFFIT